MLFFLVLENLVKEFHFSVSLQAEVSHGSCPVQYGLLQQETRKYNNLQELNLLCGLIGALGAVHHAQGCVAHLPL